MLLFVFYWLHNQVSCENPKVCNAKYVGKRIKINLFFLIKLYLRISVPLKENNTIENAQFLYRVLSVHTYLFALYFSF